MEKRKIGLDGKTWTKFSVSVWDIAKTKEENKLKHPAMFPVELCERLIRIYTHPGDTVLDPFAGSGSALISARSLARKGIGFDTNSDYIELCKKRLRNMSWGARLETNSHTQTSLMSLNGQLKEKSVSTKPAEIAEKETEVFNDSCFRLDDYVKPESVAFVLTSPPYWDILRQKRTADYKEIRKYSDKEEDLGNITDYDEFIRALGKCFHKCHNVLKPGGHCAIVVMDIRKGDKFYSFHSDIANEMQRIGFKFEDIIIWNRLREYNNLRSLGYPYVFRVNKIHEYILIFKK